MTRDHVHEAAAVGFGRVADAYERGRPGYPAAAISWLAERLGLGPGTVVVDVAAGTGKLSRALAEVGGEVVAVEPVAAMRNEIGPGVAVLDGVAEALPLADASADAITVAQAFHWFDGDAALREFHRVLRPGGALALAWNVRPLQEPIHAAIEEILAPHRRGVPSHRSSRWREPFERTGLFGPLEERTFANEQHLDAGGLADRVGSTSFIAVLPDEERERVLASVRALVGDGTVRVPYVTTVEVTERA
jgi:SAM-dependent methyltransferase